jgi:hypothetical protein
MAIVVALCGCAVESAGPTQHDYRSIELDQSEIVHVNLHMGAGHMRVGAGTQKLMRADFSYNIPSWKPYVHYTSSAGRADLSIEQPGGSRSHFGHTRYEWDVRLNRDVPLALNVNCGAGDADLDVGSLALRSVEVDMGVGRMNLDLRGHPKRDYDVRIRGGVGEVTVRLPQDVGVSAEAEGGIGEIKASGLHKDGRHYSNEAYGHSKVAIHLDVKGGIGEIRLIEE